VRRLCKKDETNTYAIKVNITLKYELTETQQNKIKVNFGSAQRLFKCCELPDRNSHAIWRDFEILRSITNFLFIRFTISHFTPKDVLRKPGWEVLIHAVASLQKLSYSFTMAHFETVLPHLPGQTEENL
jgi:hypothetical protein